MPTPQAQPAGWYADPWGVAPWRWWDGAQWSARTGLGAGVPASAQVDPGRSPRLPPFLSPLVLVMALPGLLLLAYEATLLPIALLLGLVPLAIVGPVLWWIDRIEPEPWSERIHAFLWGVFVAGGVALIVNSLVGAATGSEALVAVVCAPIVEEAMKGLAVVWAVRRRQIDGIMDGLVYAGWAALGFAVIEDISYFVLADDEGVLTETFVLRALLTPFAHPLFTAWIGLAVGLAVRRRARLRTAWWGFVVAVGAHAAWNGSLTLGGADEDGAAIVGIAALAFVVLFIATAVGVVRLRRRDHRRLRELGPALADRYGIPADQVAGMLDHRARRRLRKTLAKPERRAFDQEAGAITRLGYLFDHDSPPDPADEARLVTQFRSARGA